MAGDPDATAASSAGDEDSRTRGVTLRHARASIRAELFGASSTPVTIGRYEVRGKLGQGGMGTVYLAEDPMLRRKVAIKVIRTETNATNMKRLRREAKAMASAWHPNVVKVFGVEREGERTAIVMEYVPGWSLDAWLRRRPRPLHRIIDVFRQAALGLRAAHRLGLVHRDFKPGNVLVERGGRTKVADFGLATTAPLDSVELEMHTRDPTMSLTVEGTVMGTPAYMAPEQHLGVEVDASADTFAFFVTLIQAITGQRPFTAPTLLDLYLAKKKGVRVSLGHGRALRPLERAIERGLAHDRTERPSMDRLIEVLQPPVTRPGPKHLLRIGALAVVVGSAGHAVAPNADTIDADAARVP